MTQVDRAIEVALGNWLGPAQLTAASGRRNPEGMRRDLKRAAYRLGLWFHEWRIVPTDGSKPYKAVMLTRAPLEFYHIMHEAGVESFPPARQVALEPHLARTGAVIAERREALAHPAGPGGATGTLGPVNAADQPGTAAPAVRGGETAKESSAAGPRSGCLQRDGACLPGPPKRPWPDNPGTQATRQPSRPSPTHDGVRLGNAGRLPL
jgi:hypothetical protein